jgi:hypothetical protein
MHRPIGDQSRVPHAEFGVVRGADAAEVRVKLHQISDRTIRDATGLGRNALNPTARQQVVQSVVGIGTVGHDRLRCERQPAGRAQKRSHAGDAAPRGLESGWDHRRELIGESPGQVDQVKSKVVKIENVKGKNGNP